MGKLLTLIILGAIVYAAWRWQRRKDAARAAAPRLAAETMVKCRVCGAYVAAEGARDCGYADCPYHRA